MRFLVAVMTGAALALIAVSAMMNWAFMSSLGKSEFERQILGAVSVAVSVFIAALPVLMSRAFRERQFVYIALGVPVFLAFAIFSMSSAVGFAAKNRGGISEDRGLATLRLAEVRKEISVEEAKRTALGAPRPVAVVEEAMRGLEQDRKWKWSEGCKDASTEALRSFCKSYYNLKGEVARSSELAAGEAKIERLKREARGYEEKGAGREADNQAAIIGRVVGLKPVEVEEGLSFLLAILVEIGAASGLYLATGHRRMGASTTAVPAVAFESIPVKEVPALPVMPAPKQIRGPGPRRVPRRASETTSKQEE